MQLVLLDEPPERVRIHKLLLAGNPYDAFLLEEAGFRAPGQEEPADAPEFDLVRTGAEALRALATGGYDMLLADYDLPDMKGSELARQARERFPLTQAAVITSDTDLGGVSDAALAQEANLYIWYGANTFLHALIRLHEDEMNAPALVRSGHALAILLVEDEPNFYSHFMPLLYERIRHSAMELVPVERHPQSLWEPIFNRPLALLRRNFEQSCEILYQYRTQIMAVITDMCFPVRGEYKTDAGLRLLYRARAINGHLPVAVHSRDLEHKDAACEAGARFFWKDSPRLLYELDQFLIDVCGFGPFVFRWPAGDVYGVARNLRELRQHIADVPEVVFEHHALHFDFSTWLAVHGYQELAHTVRELSITDPSPRQQVLDLLDKILWARDKIPG